MAVEWEQHQAKWVMSSTVFPVQSCHAETTGNSYTTSEQHKEMLPSRTCRDEADYNKVASELNKFSPFSEDESLHILIGAHAHETNIHHMFTVKNDSGKNSNLRMAHPTVA